jgi:hypothetical protein
MLHVPFVYHLILSSFTALPQDVCVMFGCLPFSGFNAREGL